MTISESGTYRMLQILLTMAFPDVSATKTGQAGPVSLPKLVLNANCHETTRLTKLLLNQPIFQPIVFYHIN